MTPQEANVLTFMIRVERPVGSHQIASQFQMSLVSVDLLVGSLKRELLIEQHGKFFRPTNSAKEALDVFQNHFKYVPFAGRPAW